MKQETSQWGKAVKKAVIDHDMTLKQLAEKIGYSNVTVSQVVNGRYSNSSYKVIAEKINEVLGTEGLPERTETPSDEWCQTVKVELVKQSMTVNELAKQLDVSRDRLSLVINGKMMNEAIVSGVNNLLGINLYNASRGQRKWDAMPQKPVKTSASGVGKRPQSTTISSVAVKALRNCSESRFRALRITSLAIRRLSQWTRWCLWLTSTTPRN